jgi:hypothetical protein
VLTGAEKAVLFLLSLDEVIATPIVSELTEADLRKLRAVASTMREVPAGAIDDAFRAGGFPTSVGSPSARSESLVRVRSSRTG